ncbi:MAG TPA: hypothetical protein PK177_17690 [Burkholderiaceae bacterium]|nr:hypothetical protein [Burkholderiaceae bacterium]
MRARTALAACVLAVSMTLVDALAAAPATHRDAAIDAMRSYLARAVRPDGWFVYAHDGHGRTLPGYNIVRHAGTMLAMSQALQQRADDEDLRRALGSAARRLLDCCTGPVRFERALAVWWPPGTQATGAGQGDDRPPASSGAANDGDRLASLGAAALGLIALIGADRHGVEPVPIETLRALGRFLLGMQHDDGSFRSRWFGDARDDDWRSLYYPGEAALALLWLARVDPDPALADRWSNGAVAALLALADERRGFEPVPADHWALIATAALACSDRSLNPREHDALTLHAWQVAQGMLAEQRAVEPFTGGFVDDDRVTPTATRLEGLLALQAWPISEEARQRIAGSTGPALDWLLASIPVAVPDAGAVPRHRVSERGRAYARQAEVRIDYVQHALSALLMARRLEREADVCPLLLPPDSPGAAKTELLPQTKPE